MFRTIMCSSSGGQLYEYNFWYYYSVLVAVRNRTATNTEWLYQKLYSYNCPSEHEHIIVRNM